MSVSLQYGLFVLALLVFFAYRIYLLKKSKEKIVRFCDVGMLGLLYGLSVIFTFNAGGVEWDSPEAFIKAKLILEGKVLYLDIFSEYGPFADYVNALFLKIFGVHRSVLFIQYVFLHVFTMGMTYRFGCKYLNSNKALLLCSFYLANFATYNHFSYPQSPNSNYFYTFLFSLLFSSVEFINLPRTSTLLWASFFTALILFCRPLRVIPAMGIVMLVLGYQWCNGYSLKMVFKWLLIFCGSSISFILLPTLYFLNYMTVPELWISLFPVYFYTGILEVYPFSFTETHLLFFDIENNDLIQWALSKYQVMIMPVMILYLIFESCVQKKKLLRLQAVIFAIISMGLYYAAHSDMHLIATVSLLLILSLYYFHISYKKNVQFSLLMNIIFACVCIVPLLISFWRFQLPFTTYTYRVQTPHYEAYWPPNKAKILVDLKAYLDEHYPADKRIVYIGPSSLVYPAIDRMPSTRFLRLAPPRIGFLDMEKEDADLIIELKLKDPIIIYSDYSTFIGWNSGITTFDMRNWNANRDVIKWNKPLFDYIGKHYQLEKNFDAVDSLSYYVLKKKIP